MTDLFKAVFFLSVKAIPVILIVMVARLILTRSPKKYSYVLWSIVAFRLCCNAVIRLPYSLTGAISKLIPSKDTILSVLDVKEQATSIAVQTMQTVQPSVTVPSVTAVPEVPPMTESVTVAPSPMPTLPQTDVSVSDTLVTQQSVSSGDIILTVCTVIWLTVMLGIIIHAVVGYVRMYLNIKNAIPCGDGIYASDKITSPFVMGFLRPRVYVPYGIDAETLKYSVMHEKCHIKRFDHVIKPIAYLILAVHWFNPLAHTSFRLMNRDMEMSCDEKVLSVHDNIRKEYSMALFKIALNKNTAHRVPFSSERPM